MQNANRELRRQMLAWIAQQPRTYAEVLEVWRTSCPRLSIWEDACAEGLVERSAGSGMVRLTPSGERFLGVDHG